MVGLGTIMLAVMAVSALERTSPHVTGGNSLFTLLGFMGMYPIPGVLFLALIWREIDHGPARSELAAPALTHY